MYIYIYTSQLPSLAAARRRWAAAWVAWGTWKRPAVNPRWTRRNVEEYVLYFWWFNYPKKKCPFSTIKTRIILYVQVDTILNSEYMWSYICLFHVWNPYEGTLPMVNGIHTFLMNDVKWDWVHPASHNAIMSSEDWSLDWKPQCFTSLKT